MEANPRGSCIKCGKTGGVLSCNGCQQTLCFKHVSEHQDELQQQLDALIKEESQYETDIVNVNDSHDLFYQIDEWKRDMIEQIKQIAKQAKQDLKELIHESNEKQMAQCEELKQNLRLLQDSDDLSEIQLNKLSRELMKLKKEIYTFQLVKSTNTIFLRVEKQENWDSSTPDSIPIEQPSSNINENHSNVQGSITIREVDPYGHFIIVEHTGLTTDKDQDMVGWTLQRSIDSYLTLTYRFPNDFRLKPKSSIKILSKRASQTRYSYEKKNVLVADSIQTWGTGVNTIINRLIDATGEERDIFTQTF